MDFFLRRNLRQNEAFSILENRVVFIKKSIQRLEALNVSLFRVTGKYQPWFTALTLTILTSSKNLSLEYLSKATLVEAPEFRNARATITTQGTSKAQLFEFEQLFY